MYPYFDINTLILYVVIAFCGAYCLKMTLYPNARYIQNVYYIQFFGLYVLFASLRIVTYGIVGTDAYNYQELFINCLSSGGRFEEEDIGFLYFTKIIRSITSEPIIYRFICYSIIVGSYLYFLKYFSNKGWSSIPFILIMIPFLKSLNTMRSSLAIAIYLIGLVFLLRKRNLYGIIIILFSVLIHRMSVIFILFIPFYYIFYNLINSLNISKLLIVTLITTCICYFIASKFQQYAVAMQILDGTDAYYLSKNLNGSIFDSIITLLPLILLAGIWLIGDNKLPKNPEIKMLKVMIIFDMILTPSANLLGFWRANEYFNIPRLVFWSVLITIFYSYFKKDSKDIVKYTIFLLFGFWLVYRILREWEPCGLMPYLLV